MQINSNDTDMYLVQRKLLFFNFALLHTLTLCTYISLGATHCSQSATAGSSNSLEQMEFMCLAQGHLNRSDEETTLLAFL